MFVAKLYIFKCRCTCVVLLWGLYCVNGKHTSFILNSALYFLPIYYCIKQLPCNFIQLYINSGWLLVLAPLYTIIHLISSNSNYISNFQYFLFRICFNTGKKNLKVISNYLSNSGKTNVCTFILNIFFWIKISTFIISTHFYVRVFIYQILWPTFECASRS